MKRHCFAMDEWPQSGKRPISIRRSGSPRLATYSLRCGAGAASAALNALDCSCPEQAYSRSQGTEAVQADNKLAVATTANDKAVRSEAAAGRKGVDCMVKNSSVVVDDWIGLGPDERWLKCACVESGS